MLRNTAVVMFFVWIFVDGALVFRHKTTAAENRDRHSLRLIMAGNPIAWALGIGLACGSSGGLRPAMPLQIAGFILMGSGIALRMTAIVQLGRFHTPNVAVLQGHRVVDNGLYRRIRHPSYLGALIVFLGFSLALANGWSLGIIMGMALVIYPCRIREEEAALTAALGERYRAYCRRTWRLLPGVY